MRYNKKGIIVAIIAAVVTIIGLITGWYVFVFILLPLKFFLNPKDKKK